MIQLLTKLLGVRVLKLSDVAPTEIVTPRLRLRSFRVFGDWPRYREYQRDPEVVRYLAPRFETDAKLRAQLEACAALTGVSRGYLHLAIQRADEQRLLGDISVMTDRNRHERALLGFVLHRDAWGRGIASEAARALVDHAFRVMKYSEIWAGCARQNDRSRRVLEKIGLSQTDEEVTFPGAPEGMATLAFKVDAATWLRR
jgi:RimJ/RimL family protein N-acetyltransferase